MRDMLAALVVAGTITLEEAQAVESDRIFLDGYAFAPVRVYVEDIQAALARARRASSDTPPNGGSEPE